MPAIGASIYCTIRLWYVSVLHTSVAVSVGLLCTDDGVVNYMPVTWNELLTLIRHLANCFGFDKQIYFNQYYTVCLPKFNSAWMKSIMITLMYVATLALLSGCLAQEARTPLMLQRGDSTNAAGDALVPGQTADAPSGRLGLIVSSCDEQRSACNAACSKGQYDTFVCDGFNYSCSCDRVSSPTCWRHFGPSKGKIGRGVTVLRPVTSHACRV